MRFLLEDHMWAGTETSFHAAVEAAKALSAALSAGTNFPSQEDEEPSRLLQVQDGVAVLSIKGRLNNSGQAFWNEWMGATGYPEIREALVQASGDPQVKRILLDIDSPGGTVNGLADTADLIAMINAKGKPITTFASGTMASAAYWLGSSAGEVYAEKAAMVGSIGVIATHMEQSKMLEKAGIGVNVIRSGKYKALANSVEPLTEEGRKQLQAGVDAIDEIFVEHVASARGYSVAHVREHMAEGREFYGQDAKNVGLIDAISSFDDIMGSLMSQALESEKETMQNRGKQGGFLHSALNGDGSMKKKALTEKDIAALAAGVPSIEDALNQEVPANAEAEKVEDESEKSVDEEASASETAEVEAPDHSAEVANLTATVGVLKGQIKEAQAEVIDLKVQLTKSEEKLAESEALTAPLVAIAKRAISNMSVALNRGAMSFEGMSAGDVLSAYDRMATDFGKTFKTGGVAAADAAVSKTTGGVKLDAASARRLAAVRPSK